MKSLLLAGAAGICMLVPSMSRASTLDFEVTGSQYTVLFNPQGAGSCQLPRSYYYRSYDCRIGSKPVLITFTPPPHNNPPVPNNPTPQNNNNDPTPPQNPVNPIDPVTPPHCDPASVPLPDPSAMAGVGLGFTVLYRTIRARRQARA
jgi:hypothetical protein